MAKVKSYWKFNPDAATSPEQAAKKAADLEHHMPRADWVYRFFKWAGWEFDIGRKPYLIETEAGIQRVWGRSVDDVRIGLSLGRKTKVVADPFNR